MEKPVFDKMWKRSYARWGLVAPSHTDARNIVCYDKVSFIPDMAIEWISTKLEDRDTKPSNVANEIVSLWYKWREDNPERCAYVHNCRICKPSGHPGPGYLLALRPPMQIGETWHETCLPCAECKPIGVTPEQIIKAGWKYLPEGKVPDEHKDLTGYQHGNKLEDVGVPTLKWHAIIKSIIHQSK